MLLLCAFTLPFNSHSPSLSLASRKPFLLIHSTKKEIKKKRSELYETLEGTRIKYIEDEDLYRDITEEYASERRRIFKTQTYRLREKKRYWKTSRTFLSPWRTVRLACNVTEYLFFNRLWLSHVVSENPSTPFFLFSHVQPSKLSNQANYILTPRKKRSLVRPPSTPWLSKLCQRKGQLFTRTRCRHLVGPLHISFNETMRHRVSLTNVIKNEWCSILLRHSRRSTSPTLWSPGLSQSF